MPPYEIELAIILRTFDDDVHLAEALFFPEVSRYGDDAEILKRALVRNCVRILEAESTKLLFRRTIPPSIETVELNLRLEPPLRRLTWRTPVDLRLDVIHWRHPEHAHIAYIPALGIEVVGTRLDDLISAGTDEISMVERHVRAELMRRRVTNNLKELMMLERTRELSVMRVRTMATIRSPKQVAATAGQREDKKTSPLEQTANDLTTQKLPTAYEVEDAVARLAETLTGKAARSVLLVGKAGVGKTAVFNELVRRRGQFGLGSIPFWSTSGSRLVAGMSGFGMWQERCDAVWREAEKTNAVIHFGNLVELMDTGKSEHNAQGLASFFRQRFMSSKALAVVECTPEQLSLIEREDPALLKVFLQFTVEEPSVKAGRSILAQYAANYPRPRTTGNRKELKRQERKRQPPVITEAGLDTVDRLHRRYAGYSAFPGRPLRFLRGLLEDRAMAQTEEPVDAHEVTQSFAKETGLPLFLLDDTATYDGEQTFAWFAQRVIGQDQAVGLIVDLLARVKAGLTRPRRPIASLLFVGPTGVGKTEMAKSLARFFFGDEGRMARFDMSEYADAVSVTRLVGGATGGEGTLTARVREQPFSVVLFDEFEKAHQSFFDLLLQTLGEGRLTDGRGRLADFSNSIVIMTSNLGAERFRRSRLGFHSDELDAEHKYFRAAQNHFTRAVQDFLRPEILNRIDHIVPFLPLARDKVEQIAEREVSLIEQRDGVRLRGVTLRVEKTAVESLARRGYDNRYGARPLKRLVERELLLPLATQLNSRPPTKSTRITADVRVEGTQLRVDVVEHSARKGATPLYDDASQAAHVQRLQDIRRRVQRLGRSPVVIELHNALWRMLQIERRIARAARRAKMTNRLARTRHSLQQPWEAAALERLPVYQKLAGAVKELQEATATAEDEALLVLYGARAASTEAASAALQSETELHNLLRQLLDLRYTHPNRIVIAIYSENHDSLFQLARAYFAAATSAKMNIKLAYYTANLPAQLDDEKKLEMFGRIVTRVDAQKPAAFLSAAPDRTTGIVFYIEGQSAYATYENERGLHAFIEAKMVHDVLVDASESSFEEYAPPSSLTRRGSITPVTHGEGRRRLYHRTEGYIQDRVLDERRDWQSNSAEGLSATLKEFISLMHESSGAKLIAES
ncbi:MAG TPA: AAA family ATPase [Pyrinomonadaceae bacterium]|nr:AAA family ATPase [Pyrinomonadaceae bacterium]